LTTTVPVLLPCPLFPELGSAFSAIRSPGFLFFFSFVFRINRIPDSGPSFLFVGRPINTTPGCWRFSESTFGDPACPKPPALKAARWVFFHVPPIRFFQRGPGNPAPYSFPKCQSDCPIVRFFAISVSRATDTASHPRIHLPALLLPPPTFFPDLFFPRSPGQEGHPLRTMSVPLSAFVRDPFRVFRAIVLPGEECLSPPPFLFFFPVPARPVLHCPDGPLEHVSS